MEKTLPEYGKVIMPKSRRHKQRTKNINMKKYKIKQQLFKNIGMIVFSCLCGSFSVVGNFNPIGIGWVTAFLGKGEIFYLVAISTFLGYTIKNYYGVAIYIVSLLVCVISEILFFSAKKTYKPYFKPLCGGVSIVIGSLMFSYFGGLSLFVLTRGLLEGAITASFSLIFRKGLDVIKKGDAIHILGDSEIFCLGTIAVIGIGAFAELNLFSLHVSTILFVLLILITAYKAGTHAVTIGAMCGLMFFFIGEGNRDMFLILCTGSLLAGIFYEKKISLTLSFFIGALTPGFYLGALPSVSIIISMIIGSFIFLITPKVILNKVNTFKNHETEFEKEDYYIRVKDVTENRLKNFAKAIGALAEVFETEETEKEVTPKIATKIVDKIAEEVCGNCNMSLYCWRNKNYETYEGIHMLVGAVERDGKAEKKDLTKWIESACVRTKEMIETTNIYAREYKNDIVWQSRLNESREILKEQLLCVENIVSNLTNQSMPMPVFYESTAKEIKDRLRKKEIELDSLYVAQEGKAMVISITKENCFNNDICKNIILPVVNSVTGKVFYHENLCSSNNKKCSIIFKEIKGYSMKTASATIAKNANRENGDAFYCEETDDKKGIMLLSDGMGAGKKASEESKNAVELVKKFLKAGFPLDLTLKVLNSALATGNKDVYTTMDICSIDLITGDSEIIKNGGSTIFVVTQNNVRLIRSGSLPIGAVKEWQGDISKVRLKEGNMIVMVTDGVSDALGIENELDEICVCCKRCNENPETLAKDILSVALDKNNGYAKDDMTVVVGKVVDF